MVDGQWTTCIRCQCRMWMPPALYEAALAQAGKITFYCAYGHGQVFRSKEQLREEDETRRERDRLKQENARLVEQWTEAHRKLALAVKDKTRITKRIHAGICPDCNRTFSDLARHMHSKHKGSLSSDPLSTMIRPTLEKSQ